MSSDCEQHGFDARSRREREKLGEMYSESLKRARLRLEIVEEMQMSCPWWRWHLQSKLRSLQWRSRMDHANLWTLAERDLHLMIGDPLRAKIRESATGRKS